MWARVASVALGLWLMAAPAVLGYGDPAETNDRIVGPLVAGSAYVALWQVTRPLRWLALPLGAWLIVAPWVLGYHPTALVNSVLVGGLLVGFAPVRGKISEGFGGGWSTLLAGRSDQQRRSRP